MINPVRPEQCYFWQKELTREDFNLKANFLILRMFEYEDTRSYRRLLQCHDCGQLYFFEFFEGTETNLRLATLIPINSTEDAQKLAELEHAELLKLLPRLHRDWPALADHTQVYWVQE